MSKINRSILYYPTIDIPANGWLRHALLYWDQVSSIVPSNVNDKIELSKDIRLLIDQGEFKPVRPDQLLQAEDGWDKLKEFEKEFISVVSATAFEDFLKRKQKATFSRIRDEKATLTARENLPVRHSRIHRNKTTSELHNFLVDRKLAKKETQDGWYLFERNTALLYMSLLAKYLAATADSPTSIGTDYKIYEKFNFGTITESKISPVISININNLLPTPKSTVPLKKIVDFKKKRVDNLLHFRKILLEFQNNIGKAKSKEEFQEISIKFSENIAIGVKDLTAVLKDTKIETGFKSLKSLMNYKSPVLWTAFVELADKSLDDFNISLPIKIGAMAIAGAIEVGSQYIEFRNKFQSKFRESPFSYLYEAQRRGILLSP